MFAHAMFVHTRLGVQSVIFFLYIFGRYLTMINVRSELKSIWLLQDLIGEEGRDPCSLLLVGFSPHAKSSIDFALWCSSADVLPFESKSYAQMAPILQGWRSQFCKPEHLLRSIVV